MILLLGRNVGHAVFFKDRLDRAVVDERLERVVERGDQRIAALCEREGVRFARHGFVQNDRAVQFGGKRHGDFVVHDPRVHLAAGQRAGGVVVDVYKRQLPAS